MKNRCLLTPYFIDKPVSGLQAAAGPDWQVNRPPLTPGKPMEVMSQLYRPLAQFVAQTLRDGDRPVSFAGDCCTTLAVMAGIQQAGLSPTLIWLDAHGDFNTWETTPSGFLGGMPLAMLAGRGEQTICQAVGLTPFPEAQIILTDARDLDPGEQDNLNESAVVHLPQVERLLDYPLPDGPLYVHLDVDVLDPAVFPAVDYPAPGGPDKVMMGRVLRHLAGTGRVTAVSLSAWNPDLDEDGRCRKLVRELLAALVAA